MLESITKEYLLKDFKKSKSKESRKEDCIEFLKYNYDIEREMAIILFESQWKLISDAYCD